MARIPGPPQHQIGCSHLRTALGHGHSDGLVVLRRNQAGAGAIGTRRKPSLDNCLQKPLAVAGIVDALEESELGRVRRSG